MGNTAWILMVYVMDSTSPTFWLINNTVICSVRQLAQTFYNMHISFTFVTLEDTTAVSMSNKYF